MNRFNPFSRLTSSRCVSYGLEWAILKKLPAAFLAGTMVLACFILMLQLNLLSMEEKESMKAQYSAIGLMLFHWICMLGAALVCLIVMAMKGPAYVMDAYPLPDSDSPKR